MESFTAADLSKLEEPSGIPAAEPAPAVQPVRVDSPELAGHVVLCALYRPIRQRRSTVSGSESVYHSNPLARGLPTSCATISGLCHAFLFTQYIDMIPQGIGKEETEITAYA
ncbi:hypothetical protein ACXR0O_21485 [Verrucomicrobiota bacterium sgz303538]